MNNCISNPDNLYGNCKVYSPSGIFMFRCSNKKVRWYLNKDLAKKIDEDNAIQLLFEPNGLGHHNDSYGLQEMTNQCVCCGVGENLSRHHIVPYEYRKNMPLSFKSNSPHDVIMMCHKHHKKYEKEAYLYKKELEEKYNAPLGGYEETLEERRKLKKIINLYIYSSKIKNITSDDIMNFEAELKKYTNGDLSLPALKKLKKEINKFDGITHGEMVVSQLLSTQDIVEFERKWRQHFIDKMDCQYLPEGWSVDYKHRDIN